MISFFFKDWRGLNICMQVSSHMIALISTFKYILHQLPFVNVDHLGHEIGGGINIMLLSFESSFKFNEPGFSPCSHRLNLSKSCNPELSYFSSPDTSH